MGAASALSILVTNRLDEMLPFRAAHGTPAIGGIASILLIYLVLAATAFLVKDSPGSRRPAPRRNGLGSWIFLALKIGLAIPILHCTLIAVIVVNVPFLSLGFYAVCFLVFRWIFSDQRRRCPVCRRLLGEATRIGTPSKTFLQWYGAESMCGRGHGSLYASEISASYSEEPKWLDLDESVKALCSEGAGL
jgi:hypothetical protein